ncbi:hypothetical protein BRETT_002455 [Brettanomyces bruxellensis]|uniref:Uncharacterized protein n=1 Tax=Dekkera bruxellensis TaxID=5007 RepID=A0A871RIQ1_DEKBR|nr:uncharacterized protein BRETT_002455 [Brettanomyces bruxellensis]QOU22281.1 hypothetical protein BRETT_002455 [Brettanomyces bruxellensis]
MDSDPSEGATAEIFADMFSGDGAVTSVHEQDVSANPTDSDNWVESLYQTIMDPTLASKSVTLLTESPINVATSSPTISQPSSPAPERRIGDCVAGESGPQLREEVEEEDEDEETINARNKGINGSGGAEKGVESAGSDHVTAFQPFALPTLEFLRDSLAKYTELLSKKEPMDSIPARTDFLVTHYCELHGLRLRPKAINECLAQIRRDKETAQLSARIGNKELLDEIRNLLVLSDKKRKAYNKKKSQRHQQQAEMHTSTPVKAAMVGGMGGAIGAGMYAAASGPTSAGNTATSSAGNPGNPAGNPAGNSTSAPASVAHPSASLSSISSSTPTPTPAQPAQQISTARSIRIGFCRGDASNFVGVADYGRLSQAVYREPYVQQLRARSMKVRASIDAVFGTRSSVAGENLLSHPLTYVGIPLHPARNSCFIDCDRDRMVSYAEVIVDIGQRDISGQTGQAGQTGSADTPGQAAEPGSAAVPPDFSSFVLLKVVTRVYSQAALLTCKTDPVTGYFVSPTSKFVRIMLPLQAGLWASLLNDLNNGIITEKRFDQICICQTLLVKCPGRGSNEGAGEFCPVHTFVWDFCSTGTPRQPPVAVTVLSGSNPRNMLTFPKLRGHKRARSRSLNELDRISVPPYLPEKGFYLKSRTPSGALSAVYPGFNNAVFSAPRCGRLQSAGSIDTSTGMAEFSAPYYETPLATPSDEPPVASAGHPVMFRANFSGPAPKPRPGRLALHPNTSAPVVYRPVPTPRVKPEDPTALLPAMLPSLAGSAGSSASNTSTSSIDAPQRHSVTVAEKLASCKPLAPAPGPTPDGPGHLARPVKHPSKLSNAGVAEMAPKAGCLVESLKLRFDGNYKFRYYNPEGKSDDQYAADSKK